MDTSTEPTDKPGPGKPRFLAPIGQPRDYVDRPAMGVHGEPECISGEIVNGYAEVALFHRTLQHARDVEAAQLVRPSLPAEARVKDLRRRAKGSSVDISHTLHILERDVRKARMRSQPVPVRVLERLESLEGLLDGVAA